MIAINNLKFLYLTLLILFCTVFNKVITAQSYDYEDIFDNLNNLTNEQAYTRFLNFQAQNPHFANTYLQLGNICEDIFTKTDPLRDIDLVIYWTDQARLYYGLFINYFESSDLRRNQRYYANIPITDRGQRPGKEQVISYVNNRREFAQNHRDSIKLIYNALESSKTHYNNCVRIFNNTSSSYETLNETLLQTDDNLLAVLENLESEFNACIEQFDHYKSLIEKYPLKGYLQEQKVQVGDYVSITERRVGAYNQEYNLKPIQTFRLDGITNSDFLKETFILWDYGSWVKNFRDTYYNDIIPLRTEIEEIQNTFDENTRYLTRVTVAPSDLSLDSFDELFLFRLGKYDNNSLVRELFDYLDDKQKFLLHSRSSLNNPNDSSSVIYNRKLRYYYRYALMLEESLNSANNFHNAIDIARTSRFKNFFNEYYQGIEGLFNFSAREKEFLLETFNFGLDNLNRYFNNNNHLRALKTYATGDRNIRVPLKIINEESELYNEYNYITRDIFYSNDHPKYLCGYIKKANNKVPFVAKTNEDKTLDWIREIGKETGSNRKAVSVYAYENGVLALVTDWNEPNEDEVFTHAYNNVLVHYDNSGNVLVNKELNDNFFPYYLQYDEINQLSFLSMGERTENDLYSRLSVSQADSLGNKNWHNLLNISGQLIDIVRAEGKYIAYFNFREFSSDGRKYNAGNDGKNWGLLSVDFSLDGDVISSTPLVANNSFYIDRVFNISSDEINLIGYLGAPGEEKGDMVYLVLDPDGNEIFNRSLSFIDKGNINSSICINNSDLVHIIKSADDAVIEFMLVDVQPEFVGGDDALRQYFTRNLNYPAEARRAGIQGTVFTTFIVEPDGSITNVEVIGGIGGGCDEEAIRLINNMPEWRPGRHNGQPARVQHRLPVRFNLE